MCGQLERRSGPNGGGMCSCLHPLAAAPSQLWTWLVKTCTLPNHLRNILEHNWEEAGRFRILHGKRPLPETYRRRPTLGWPTDRPGADMRSWPMAACCSAMVLRIQPHRSTKCDGMLQKGWRAKARPTLERSTMGAMLTSASWPHTRFL